LGGRGVAADVDNPAMISANRVLLREVDEKKQRREREKREDFLEKIFHEQIGRVPYYL